MRVQIAPRLGGRGPYNLPKKGRPFKGMALKKDKIIAARQTAVLRAYKKLKERKEMT